MQKKRIVVEESLGMRGLVCSMPGVELEWLQWLKATAGFYWQRSMAWSWVGIAAAALLVNQSSVVSGELCREMSKHLSALCLGITRLIQEHCNAGKVKRDTLN